MNFWGRELEILRKRVGISQYQLAKDIELSRSYISRLEKGERAPNKELINKISHILKIDLYNKNKLLVLGGCEPELSTDQKTNFRMILQLALELKNKGAIDKAKFITEFGLSIFENILELNSLLANLNLLKNDYDSAIALNEEALKIFENLPLKEQKKAGISKAEIVHNLGYVYFERGLSKKQYMEQYIIKYWEYQNNEVKRLIDELKEEIKLDFDISIKKMELSYSLDSGSFHILDQIARIYFQKADISEELERLNYFNKTIDFYSKVISFPSYNSDILKKQEASIFMAFALGKIFELDESLRIINTVINFQPLYYLGYYVKSCIYAINAKENINFLKASYETLKYAIELNEALKEDIKFEVDLYNLRFSEEYKDKFIDLSRGVI